jgi:hypothetical protein
VAGPDTLIGDETVIAGAALAVGTVKALQRTVSAKSQKQNRSLLKRDLGLAVDFI